MENIYFPFTLLSDFVRFSSRLELLTTHSPPQVDLRHKDEAKDSAVVVVGIDLTEFYQSVEWDILSVPAQR